MPRQVDLEFENLQVLLTVQALTGEITENVRAVTITCRASDSVDVTFVLYREDPELREDIIEEFVPEFEALQESGSILGAIKVVIDNQPFGEERKPWMDGRIVFLRKELWDQQDHREGAEPRD